jgi:hypothetical protein
MKTRRIATRKRRPTTTLMETDLGPVKDDARSARLTGGDVDADWKRAEDVGDEAVGGSVATPDQDVVDEIGRALGLEREDEEEFRTSAEILVDRDRFRWHLERDAEDEAAGRHHRRRGTV